MFSGIIEYLGNVESISHTDVESRLVIKILKLNSKILEGDSIAVNGVCLTVKKIIKDNYEFDLSPETIKVTALSDLIKNDRVNVELPLTLNKFISGHITTGHIDTIGILKYIEKMKDAWFLKIEINKLSSKYIVQKGSIALDGVSLTVNVIDKTLVDLMIIPHTYNNTIIKFYKLGQRINIEVDYIAKHLEKLKNG